MEIFYQFVLRAAVNIDLRCLAVSQTSSENLAWTLGLWWGNEIKLEYKLWNNEIEGE